MVVGRVKSGRAVRSRDGRRISLIAFLSAMALLVAACGGDDPEPPAEESEPPAEESEPPAEESEAADDEAEETAEESEAAANPLEGQRVALVHGHSPAGGYQAYAQLIAPFLAEELGVDVVVENEPGAGGLIALNTTFGADPDGTRIQLLNGPGTANSFLSGDPNTDGLDLAEVVYLGQVSGEPMAVYVSTDSEFETFEDMLASDRPVRFGTSGPGSADWAPPRIFEYAFDMNLDMITGFDTAEIVTAILRGEVDGIVATIDSRREQAEEGDFRPLVLMATERSDAEWFTDLFPDTPAQVEFDDMTDDEGATLLEVNAQVTGLGRVLTTAPGTPEDIVGFLRDAVERMMNSEAFQAEADNQGLALRFTPGQQYEETMLSILSNAPDSYGRLLGED